MYSYSAEPRVYLGITVDRVLCSCKLKLVTQPPLPLPLMVGAEETKNFDFDNPRSLKISGKELHRAKLLLLKVLKLGRYLLLKNVEEIFRRIFLGANNTAKTVSKYVWVRR